jgi:hypothetical protein
VTTVNRYTRRRGPNRSQPTTAATNATSPDSTHRAAVRRHLEIVATVVLSAATVLTAWNAFENAKWIGEQAT